jgi:gluconate 2-dehydrogenase subunit 3-like protein
MRERLASGVWRLGEEGALDAASEPAKEGTDGISRRAAVAAVGLVPIGAAVSWADVVDKLSRLPNAHTPDARRQTPDAPYAPKFFSAHEYATVRVLVDIIIPADERSGSATEARVPEFMDTLLADDSVSDKASRTAMRGGLGWMDREAHARYGKTFVLCTPSERTAIVNDIAWPAKAKPEVSQGAAFFSSFRDLTASGFWSSPMGVKDLQYLGNRFVPEWKGCPPEALAKLGVDYA